MEPLVTCPQCSAELNRAYFNTRDFRACPDCGAPLRIITYPALFADTLAVPAAQAALDGQASCFYHPGKEAVIPCETCGRYLCALCDVELGKRHLCPNCLARLKESGDLAVLENHRVLHDSIALKLAVYPLLLFFITVFTAPAAFYLAIKHWNAPGSIIPRGKTRLVLAIVISGLQILAWVMGCVYALS